MKIEASESAYGEGGAVVCSVPELLPPIAQDGQASIGPRLQQQPGCGPADGPFDCEHFQFIDDSDDEETPPAMSGPLKSLLKRGRSGHGRGVTFNEAVTLYCDDGEGVQLLQLTTGPDIVAEAAYYGMFEPPIEYQDIEPPAEYRDSEDPPEPAPAPVEEPPPPPVVEEEVEEMVVDKVEVEVVEPTEEDEEVVVEVVEEEDPLPSPNESDKLIERFLEAEGVFPVDEELNSVFRELHSDFMGDGQNGTLDDTLFRNLISFLSNAEEIPLEAGDFFSTTKFEGEDVTPTASQEDGLQAHSRTMSEADSDCSISSQDTIIVRLGEEEGEQQQQQQQSERGGKVAERVKAFESQAAAKPIPEPRLHKQESLDEVFNSDRSAEGDSRPLQPPPGPLPRESIPQKIQQQQQVVGEESLSRQSSGETSVTDPPADADDSTSSDSRSGEVEEEMRLDDIGYDEEDADDYDEESFRGMAHGNSKIRRIIKKNALQCTLFRGIEAKRRQQPGIKYPRPKSPLLSQESLVEKLKWLTTVDEPKEGEGGVNFHSKPPDVILSTGGIPVNGSIPHGGAEEHNPSAMPYPQQFYQMQRFALTPNAKGGYYVRHDGYHPSLPRPRMAGGVCSGGHPMPPPPPGWRMMAPWAAEQQQQQNRSIGSMTVPRNFRDWRVIQRVMVGRSDQQQQQPQQQQQQPRTSVGAVPADYVRCQPPGVATNGPRTRDELEQFVEQDSQRLDRIRKRYSVAEDDDDPTFGFARRPSVRGVQGRIQTPSEHAPIPEEARYGTWNGGYRGPMHIHRASVALTELPGNATIPYAHRKHPDPRYHSYAESMYGSTRTLPAKTWDPRMMLQVVPPPAKDERGVPEGASSSPKISSDSLYHSPVVPDPIPPGGAPPHKDEGVIYYSLNV